MGRTLQERVMCRLREFLVGGSLLIGMPFRNMLERTSLYCTSNWRPQCQLTFSLQSLNKSCMQMLRNISNVNRVDEHWKTALLGCGMSQACYSNHAACLSS